MSSSKLDRSGVFQPVKTDPPETQLTLAPHAVRVHKSGIQFRTGKPMPVWKEMTVAMESPGKLRKTHFTGVVVDCEGDRHAGYQVSLVFTSVTRHAHEQLSFLAGAAAV